MLPLTSNILDLSRINSLRSHRPIYHKYPSQTNPQPAYVWLSTQSGEVGAEYNPEIGNAIPESVYCGLIRRYDINPYLTCAAIQRAVKNVLPDLETVLNHAEWVWDGHNHTARMDTEATAAEDRIIKSLRETFLA